MSLHVYMFTIFTERPVKNLALLEEIIIKLTCKFG